MWRCGKHYLLLSRQPAGLSLSRRRIQCGQVHTADCVIAIVGTLEITVGRDLMAAASV